MLLNKHGKEYPSCRQNKTEGCSFQHNIIQFLNRIESGRAMRMMRQTVCSRQERMGMGDRIGREIMGMSKRSAPYIITYKEYDQQVFRYGTTDRFHMLPIWQQRYLFILVILLQNSNDSVIISRISFGTR